MGRVEIEEEGKTEVCMSMCMSVNMGERKEGIISD